jgi:hypothetical protein
LWDAIYREYSITSGIPTFDKEIIFDDVDFEEAGDRSSNLIIKEV